MRHWLIDLCLFLGFACVVAGVALWSRPAGLIVLGVILVLGAVRAVHLSPRDHGHPERTG